MNESIVTKSGVSLIIEMKTINNCIEITINTTTNRECILHWGLLRHRNGQWSAPAPSTLPANSEIHGHAAVQTPFIRHNNESEITIRLQKYTRFSDIVFVLFFPKDNQWDNNKGKNYHIRLQSNEWQPMDLAQIIKKDTKDKDILFEHLYYLSDSYQMAVAVVKDVGVYKVILISDMPGSLVLHWGVGKKTSYEWLVPDDSFLPDNSIIVENSAETPFVLSEGINRLVIEFKKEDSPKCIQFVLKQIETDRWFKDHGRNYHIVISDMSDNEGTLDSYELIYLIKEIINAEMGHNSWTLMHRFNLCYDLLDRTMHDTKGLAVIYIWLRFSAIRQLDWQRNYNTKPKELSHSQDRLTLKLADMYINSSIENRKLIRLIITTLGRGGEGQRIRDDILDIMHRHHIKEVSGHFMEEWHQKLHNNTTPDDIAICHAYLEFLRSDGDLGHFYKTLEDGGVTKERLESFERPITTPPDFVPHLKDGLIHDFENYLHLLKSIHSGTDLESAINTVRNLFDEDTNSLLSNILYYRDDNKESAVNLAAIITETRRRLNIRLNSDRENHSIRSFLYLDLALEEYLRVIVERNIHFHFDGDQLVELIGTAIENLQFVDNDEVLTDCFNQWEYIKKLPHFGHDWSLHARSILDRLERLTGAFIDHFYQLFQSKAELLGTSLNVDSWAITLFSEEAVRGQPAFVLSLLIRQIDPLLRKNANLGNWQIISRGDGKGQLEIIDNLQSIQKKTYKTPTVIIADKVMGDEEIPENVKAVITPDSTDIVSHVAVRARNSHILFATCYDADIIEHLKSLNDHFFNFETDVTGNVIFEECSKEIDIESSDQPLTSHKLTITEPPDFVGYAISEKHFKRELVGGKSINISRLRGKLPEWIHIPHSVAIPFGIFEKVLNSDMNIEISGRYNKLLDQLEKEYKGEEILVELRNNILELRADEEMMLSLEEVMKHEMITWPEDWNKAWKCIKRVWASKWNERAYLSRKTNRIPHTGLFMAVLIQQVINADYAFVIHTINPFASDKKELYAEVVPGLGETLVSNYPGRALSFTADKVSLELKLLSFPSKNIGIFGNGIIFRSDSNGEDLEGYAGAGLYDSVMLEPSSEEKLSYANEQLVMDDDFRNKLLVNICKIGIEVENAFEGVPQDIEGVYSDGNYYVVQSRNQVGV